MTVTETKRIIEKAPTCEELLTRVNWIPGQGSGLGLKEVAASSLSPIKPRRLFSEEQRRENEKPEEERK
jgi:hypothetical protein